MSLAVARRLALTSLTSVRSANTTGVDSWIEISSQPSSSSLSSAADEIVTTGLRVEHDSNTRRRRRLRPTAPTHLNITSRAPSVGGTSSQEEYDESESESDRVMTSSNEGLALPLNHRRDTLRAAPPSTASDATDDEDENRTAINFPTSNESCFTPQPNAFSHPPAAQSNRNASQPVPGSYFPSSGRPPPRANGRHSYPAHQPVRQQQHSPFDLLSPSHNVAADNEAALRASLSTLLSCAAAARGLPKSGQQQPSNPSPRPAPNRVEPTSLRLVPESALRNLSPAAQHIDEPTFKPTIRRTSTSTTASAESRPNHIPTPKEKRKANARNSSKDRRAVKKARRSSSAEDLTISPTLLTWVVSAGVVVVLSALSFSAGYAIGKETGRMEALGGNAGEVAGCARDAGRSSLGFKRLRFRGVGVGA